MTEQEKLNRKFLRAAIREGNSGMNKNHGGPFGCVIVKDGKVIAKGHNRVTSKNDPTAHAEIEAIRAACKKLKSFKLTDCTIYSSCEPCPMCLAAIYWSKAKALVYSSTSDEAAEVGFSDAYIHKEMSLDILQRELPTEHIELKQSKELFENWKNKEDKTMY